MTQQAMTPMTRHIEFDGIQNFRDFGGYVAAGGRRMRRGRFFRSASHHQASDADLERLRRLELGVIVDLRQPSERQREPSRRWEGFAAQVVENAAAELHEDFHTRVRSSDLSADWFHRHATDFYARAPYEPRHIDLFRRYFRALAGHDGALLVHCAAGKDRTGLICALTHHVAGVHRDDLLADYLLTNDERRLPALMAFAGGWMQESLGRRPTDEALRVAVSVHPEYLERAFAEMEAREGSIDAYLADRLGLDAALRDRVRARLLD
jgi:protein tyrosine/serine phosphatase